MNLKESGKILEKIYAEKNSDRVLSGCISDVEIEKTTIGEDDYRVIIWFNLAFGRVEADFLNGLGSWCIYSIQPRIPDGKLQVGVY